MMNYPRYGSLKDALHGPNWSPVDDVGAMENAAPSDTAWLDMLLERLRQARREDRMRGFPQHGGRGGHGERNYMPFAARYQ
jgi:hypothetical protein